MNGRPVETQRCFGRTVPARRLNGLALALVAGAACSGCSSNEAEREKRAQNGYMYYLDGAGGGSKLHNYAGGVNKGLIDAGYLGDGEVFKWNTGLGVVADQTSSVGYKRKQAAKLSEKIQAYREQHPGAPVTLMGLSAGTALAAFTLEALPPDVGVDQVVLLSGSLSSTYDLTEALRRVNDQMYIFTSERDGVLGTLVPLSGTADRQRGAKSTIGLSGPELPPNASAETRALYGKIVEIAWNEEFKDYGHKGGHTDVVKAPFVKAVVAPLVLSQFATATPGIMDLGEQPNPEYKRWASFSPGSWTEWRGTQKLGGETLAIHVREQLVKRDGNMVQIDRTILEGDAGEGRSPARQREFVTKTIDPKADPLLHPSSKVGRGARGTLLVGGQRLDCEEQTITAEGDFPEWGRNPRITVQLCGDLPSGCGRLHVETEWQGQPGVFDLEAVAFHVAR